MEANPSNWKKTFFLIWTGQALSLIGSQMVHFAIAWWLTQSTGSAVVLATIAIFGLLPQVFLGPFIGALVDRWNRRLVMILSDSLIALFTLGLAALFLTGRVEYWHLYAMALLRGALGTFHWSAMQASTSLMVPREQLSRVAGLNQTLFGILNIATPPLGALVVSLLPIGRIMLIDVTTAMLAVIPLLFVRIPQPAGAADAGMVTPRMVLRDVAEGFRYIRAWPGMLIILGMATLVNFLLNPTGTLTPLLITRHFGGGAWHLSAIESAWGIGMIAGGLLLSLWGGFRRRIVTSMLSLSLAGISILLVGLVPPELFLLALVANAVSGMMNPLINGPLMALTQEHIAPEMQGRVFSLIGSLAAAMSPLGMALAAPVADGLGIRVWWWIGGSISALLGLLVLAIPAVLHVEDRKPPAVPGPGQDRTLVETATAVEPAAD